MQVAAFRIFFGFVILIPMYFKAVKKLTHTNWIHVVITGYAGVFFPAFLFTKAQTQISSSLAGMINSLAPFFALITGLIIYKNRPGKWQYLGILLGFIGAIGLISRGNIISSLGNINGYALYVVIATIGYGINAGIYLLTSDFSSALATENWPLNLSFIFILALFGSVISQFFFNNLIQHTSALFATSVTYIIPFFAILWGLADGESITLLQLASISLALLGVWLVNKK